MLETMIVTMATTMMMMMMMSVCRQHDDNHRIVGCWWSRFDRPHLCVSVRQVSCSLHVSSVSCLHLYHLNANIGLDEVLHVVPSDVIMGWTGWAKSRRLPSARAPEFQAEKLYKKISHYFPVTVKIRTSGYQTLECSIATLPT